MKVTLGKDGLTKTWQDQFPETVQCCWCKGEARIGFVVHEGLDDDDRDGSSMSRVYCLHENEGAGGFWPHDTVAVAGYFCKDCLETTSLYNQA